MLRRNGGGEKRSLERQNRIERNWRKCDRLDFETITRKLRKHSQAKTQKRESLFLRRKSEEMKCSRKRKLLI